jgi:hypothetical protein
MSVAGVDRCFPARLCPALRLAWGSTRECRTGLGAVADTAYPARPDRDLAYRGEPPCADGLVVDLRDPLGGLGTP